MTALTSNVEAPSPAASSINRPGYQDYRLLVALGAVWGSSFMAQCGRLRRRGHGRSKYH